MSQPAKEVNQPIKTFINLCVRAPSQSTKSATFSDLWATMQVSLLLSHLLADCPTKGWMTYGSLIKRNTFNWSNSIASILIYLKRLSYWNHLDGLLYYWSTGHNFFMGGNMAELSERWTRNLTSRGLFLESPSNFSGQEGCFVFVVFAFKINNFENNATKLSADEAKLTGLWDRNCATIYTIQQVLKFARELEKLSGLSRNGPRVRVLPW